MKVLKVYINIKMDNDIPPQAMEINSTKIKLIHWKV